ncbi:MAG: M48 family metallopeptidase [Planctomycetes bacterium]|nr:M48 family metallopeptidase [Planctomycetota bacterium]
MSGSFRFIPLVIGLIVLASFMARGCKEGPFGRSQLITITPEQELQLGRQAYQQVLSKERSNVVQNDPIVDEVRDVGNRLRIAADDPAIRAKLGIAKDLKLEWEFNVVRSNQVNAFCLPGGKVVVYTGILPVCQNDAGLAVVMGHEIGHALARHGAERMTQGQMYSIAQMAVASSLGGLDHKKQMMVMGMLGAGAQFGVLLPFSRSHESEADRIGITLMAAAGYDPREASRFWIRMSEKAGKSGPEFMSTHPSHETRVADLLVWEKEALPYYENRPHAPDRSLMNLGRDFSPTPKPRERQPVPNKGPGWEIK